MTQNKRTLLVTSALPYANGKLHLGHLLGYIQADIWVRFQKMQGHDCLYLCGSDAHGTPIMIKADELGVTPETLVAEVRKDQLQDFNDFSVDFDNFYTTHSEENHHLASEIYQKLLANGDITRRTIRQAFDPVKNMFLPDRYVKGECPRCHTQDQYGDSCENCGATYTPLELINPKSVISGATPIEKKSEHLFFSLQNYQAKLQAWTHGGHLQAQITHKLDEWFQEGLREWDISRDAPYFGFEIPNEPGKYFYVWLDAPIGYMASLANFCKDHPEYKFLHYWKPDSTAEVYHFIGKDIVYFHSLFWPAMLLGADYRTPTAIFANGFVTVNGQKMSKSRGTFITAQTLKQHLNPEQLRYYFATKLNSHIEDADINFEDLRQRINSDLVGKVINIASRSAGFIHKHHADHLGAEIIHPALLTEFMEAGDVIARLYEEREYSSATRLIMELADKANQYIAEEKPWELAKQPGQEQKVIHVSTLSINLFRLLILYLKPILPKLALETETFLNIAPLQWQDKNMPLLKHTINTFKPLMTRIEAEQIAALITPS